MAKRRKRRDRCTQCGLSFDIGFGVKYYCNACGLPVHYLCSVRMPKSVLVCKDCYEEGEL